jgi:peptide-methionine (S)-S-oxide reductase
MSDFRKSVHLPSRAEALPDRPDPIAVPERHAVLRVPLKGPFPAGMEQVQFGMGCFWGAERLFWRLPGVYTTAVGYAGGQTRNPSYEDVCSGRTGHAEVVLVVYDPEKLDFEDLLKTFWEQHDPTQGMRQGGDIGTQYRSAIYTTNGEQLSIALASRDKYQQKLVAAGRGAISTEIGPAPEFFYAEDYHQQYLHKNPNGYCGLGGCGVRFDA